MSDAEKAFFAKVEPSPSWFAIGLKFGFGFFTAAFLFSVIFGLLWVFFIGAILAGAAARHSSAMPTLSPAPAPLAQTQTPTADAPTEETFAAPLSTLPPEKPPAPPENAPDAASPDFNKWQRDHGLVLWNGEWVKPEEREALRRQEEESKQPKPAETAASIQQKLAKSGDVAAVKYQQKAQEFERENGDD